MTVKWTPTAKKQWRKAAKYIQKKFGDKSRVAFMQEVLQTSLLLGQYPNTGKIEPYLANQPFLYRSIVVSRINKIVYRTHDNIVYIVALWDTRREPTKQAQQTIESLNMKSSKP